MSNSNAIPSVQARRWRLSAPEFTTEAFLQARMREEMLSRLEPVQITPTHIVDLGGGTGLAAKALLGRYRKSKVTLVDSSPDMLAQTTRQQGWWRRFDVVHAPATNLPLADASADMVVAGFLLPFLRDPRPLLAEVRRILKPRGYFTFTTLGATTLQELRAAFSRADEIPHVADFMDLHDLGDAIHAAGFVAPVLDADRLTVTYASFGKVLADVRAGGGATSFAGRRSLTGSRRWRAAQRFFEEGRQPDGRIPVTVELVYGQAWAVDPDTPRQSEGPREVVVPLSSVRRR